MSEAAAAQKKPLPVVSFLKIPDQGEPYLEGLRCEKCKAVFLGARDVCSSCGERGKLKAEKLANKGELYVYSITYRSFPGVETPYVSAVVDLAGGGTVKGNLVGIDPDPKQINMRMPVEVIYKIAPRKDREGNEYLTYYFQPAKA
jgi:uncharacterized OB-fold protein